MRKEPFEVCQALESAVKDDTVGQVTRTGRMAN